MATMRRDPSPSVVERLRVLVLAAAGAVCGHAITYALCLPDLRLRTSVLRQTGHAYWHGAVAGAFVGAAWFAVSHARCHVRAGRDGHSPDGRYVDAFRALATLQLATFVAVEIVERVEVGRSITAITDHNVLAVGLVIQVAVAAVLALCVRLLARAAEVVGRALAGVSVTARPALGSWAGRSALLPRPLVVAPCGSRAPPLA
jgi:hypothetical protein